jgi:hypothetical protein
MMMLHVTSSAVKGFRDDLVECLSRRDFSQPGYNAWYLETYGPFVDHFRERIAVPGVQRNDAIIGVALVYSWMPTMPKRACHLDFEAVREALFSCIQGNPTADNVGVIKAFVGGSMVAASKFLHFCSPDKYPIWDSRVVRGGYKRSWNEKKDSGSKPYIDYLEHINSLKLPERIIKQVGEIARDFSVLRIKEFAIFSLGASELMEIRTSRARRKLSSRTL